MLGPKRNKTKKLFSYFNFFFTILLFSMSVLLSLDKIALNKPFKIIFLFSVGKYHLHETNSHNKIKAQISHHTWPTTKTSIVPKQSRHSRLARAAPHGWQFTIRALRPKCVLSPRSGWLDYIAGLKGPRVHQPTSGQTLPVMDTKSYYKSRHGCVWSRSTLKLFINVFL